MKRIPGSQLDFEAPSGGPLYLKLGEVARAVGVPPSTIRYWQEVFVAFLHPVRTTSGRHVYSQDDLRVFQAIHRLVHQEGCSSREVQERLPAVLAEANPLPPPTSAPVGEDSLPPCEAVEPAGPDSENWKARVKELEALLDQARMENEELRRRLDSLIGWVTRWTLRMEEEASDPPLSDPPPG